MEQKAKEWKGVGEHKRLLEVERRKLSLRSPVALGSICRETPTFCSSHSCPRTAFTQVPRQRLETLRADSNQVSLSLCLTVKCLNFFLHLFSVEHPQNATSLLSDEHQASIPKNVLDGSFPPLGIIMAPTV